MAYQAGFKLSLGFSRTRFVPASIIARHEQTPFLFPHHPLDGNERILILELHQSDVQSVTIHRLYSLCKPQTVQTFTDECSELVELSKLTGVIDGNEKVIAVLTILPA
jgi:hypothetical protein